MNSFFGFSLSILLLLATWCGAGSGQNGWGGGGEHDALSHQDVDLCRQFRYGLDSAGFIKVSKTGTTSTAVFFQELARARRVRALYQPFAMVRDQFAKVDRQQQEPQPCWDFSVHHFAWNDQEMPVLRRALCSASNRSDVGAAVARPAEQFFFSAVRDPLERMKSHYIHSNSFHKTMSFEDWYRKVKDQPADWSGRGWRGTDLTHNFMTHYMGYTEDEVDSLSVSGLARRYRFIMVLEMAELSDQVLLQFLGSNDTQFVTKSSQGTAAAPVFRTIANGPFATKKKMTRSWSHPTDRSWTDLSPELEKEFKANNRADYLLWDLSKQYLRLLEHQCLSKKTEIN